MKSITTMLLAVTLCVATALGQLDESKRLESVSSAIELTDTAGWNRGAGIGLDIGSLLLINPRVGAGDNRIGLGGAFNYFAKYKRERLAWDNILTFNFAMQKIGSGQLSAGAGGGTEPFQKNIDELRLNSKVGYKMKPDSELFYAVDFSMLTQVAPTYPGNFLRDVMDAGGPIAKFFAPATVNLSVGIDYKPQDNLSLYVSPVGLKTILVLDDAIATMPVFNGDGIIIGSMHGNPIEGDGQGNVVDFSNAFVAMGATVRATYTKKYMEDRMSWTSNMLLFSNYLDKPQNIDIDWTNEVAFRIFEGLQFSLTANLFYDHDVFVQKTDFNEVGGVARDANGNPVLQRNVSLTFQPLLKYIRVF